MEDTFSSWFYPMCKWSGILPLTPHENRLKFSWLSAVRCLIATSFALYWNIKGQIVFNFDDFGVIPRCDLALGWICSICGIIIPVVTIIKTKMNAFEKIAQNLATFNQFWKSKTTTEPRFHNVLTIHFIAFNFVLKMIPGIAVSVSNIYFNFGDILIALSIIVFQCNILIINIVQAEIMSRIARSFKRLNKLLKYTLKTGITVGQDPRTDRNTNVPRINVDEIGDMHALLIQTVDEVNSFFGVQNGFYFVYICLSNVIRPNIIMDGFINPTPMKEKMSLFVWVYLFDILNVGLQLLLLSYIATYTAGKAKRTAYHMSHLLRENLSKRDAIKVKDALMQISNSKAQLRVMDLFDVDMSLVSSTVGIAVGVFILQLK